MSNIKEVRSLTGLRGVAAIYVVFYHFLPALPMNRVGSTFVAHGYLAVDLFFVLSGFVMTLNYTELFRSGFSRRAFGKFLGRRIARVYPLYFVTTLCAALLLALGMRVSTSYAPVHLDLSLFRNLLMNLLMVQSWGFGYSGYSLDGPGWSISAELAAYLLFPLFLWIGFKAASWRARVGTIIAGLSLVALNFISPLFLQHPVSPNAPFDIYAPYHSGAILRCLPEFFIGVFIARLMTQNDSRQLWTRRYVAEGIAITLALLLCFRNTDLLIVLLVPFFILSLTHEESLPGRFFCSAPMHHLGLLSYSIYLIHELLSPIVRATRHVLDAHGVIHGQTLAAIPALILTYFLSVAAFRYIETPGRRILRNYFEGQPSARRSQTWVGSTLGSNELQQEAIVTSGELQ
jgi:peptidoglycan/LPS O-acetylase OafA/YrhL